MVVGFGCHREGKMVVVVSFGCEKRKEDGGGFWL